MHRSQRSEVRQPCPTPTSILYYLHWQRWSDPGGPPQGTERWMTADAHGSTLCSNWKQGTQAHLSTLMDLKNKVLRVGLGGIAIK